MDETVEAIGYKADLPSRVRENVDERVELARSVVGDTIGTVNKTLGATMETVKQTFDTTRERVAATVAQTADYLPDRETIADNAQALAESAQAIAGALGTNGQRLAENAQALAGTLGSNAQQLAGNAQTVAGSVGTNAKRAYTIVRENPLGLLIGGLAVGFLAGLVAPISDVERQKIGPIRDDLLQKSTTAAQGAIVQGLAGTNVASSPEGTTDAPSI
jgi:ElaB/YqjD/DUF883 family membrane-anchored ribosome-binding protein